MIPVKVQPGVYTDLADIFKGLPDYRNLLGDIQTDLLINLPNSLARWQSNRPHSGSPFFYYECTYSLDFHSFDLRMLRFVVRDKNPTVLEVIYVQEVGA